MPIDAKPAQAPVMTIAEFRHTHRISRAMFYKLIGDNRGPRVMRVGTRVLITQESAAAWRRSLEGGQVDSGID